MKLRNLHLPTLTSDPMALSEVLRRVCRRERERQAKADRATATVISPTETVHTNPALHR